MANPFISALQSFTPDSGPVMAADESKYRKLAEMLRKQSMMPDQGQMVSGHYVPPSWTQHLAKALGGWQAGQAERKADAAAQQGRADFTDTAQKYAAALRGTPEQVSDFQSDNPFGEDLGNLQSVTPAQPGSQEAANSVAMQSNSPLWQQFAMQQQIAQARKSPRDQFGAVMPGNYTPESLAAFQQSGNYGDLVPVMKGAAFGQVNPGQFTPESLARYSQTGNYADLVPFRSPVQIDQGWKKTLYDYGTRGITEFDVGLKPGELPAVRAAQAGAEAQAKAGVEQQTEAVKKGKTADSLLSNITAAEKILTEGKATGSLIGTGVAKAKGAIGVSDASTKANQQLKLISGWMVSNVPRMEGPQSNYDLQNYREMAAMVGDSTIPIGDRLSALKQLRALQTKYKKIQGANTRPPLDSLWGD